MSEESRSARPRQVTVAGWSVIVGSVIVVLTTIDSLGRLRSLENREAIADLLAEPPLSGTGLSVPEIVDVMHAAAVVAAVCAAAAAVLGWFVLQRHAGARIGLTVIALPLLISGFVNASLLASFVAVLSLMLWMQPARAWLDGIDVPQPPRRPEPPTPTRRTEEQPHGWGDRAAPHLTPGERGDGGTDGGARAFDGFGRTGTATAPTGPPAPSGDTDERERSAAEREPVLLPGPDAAPGTAPWPAPAGTGTRPGPVAPTPGGPVGPRPPAVVVAGLITFVFAGLGLIGSIRSAWVLATDPGPLMREALAANPDVLEQGVTEEMLQASAVGISVVAALVCLTALTLCVFAVRGRRRPAAIGWVVCCAVTAFFCALAGLVQPVAGIPALAALACLLLLRRPEVRAWFAPSAPAGPPPGAPWPR